MTIQTEGGLRPSRIEYVEEATQGETPTDPNWQSPSDRITDFSPDGLGPEFVEKQALGDVDPDLVPGLESPSLTLEYDLQQWFVDANGDPVDIAGYGMLRRAGVLPSSLTIVERMQSGEATENILIEPTSTEEYRYNGNEGSPKETRIYTVMQGCDASSVTLTADMDEVDWHSAVDFEVENARSYKIDQPGAATSVAVRSTSTNDTTQDVIIESDGATTTETLTLNGNTVVGTTATFDSIDAIRVVETGTQTPADHEGDIVVSINTADSTAPAEGDALAILYGSDYYGNTNGDHGIPLLGAGSHAGEIGSDFLKATNMSVERPDGEPFEATGAVQSAELTIENDIERTPISGSRSQRLHHGGRSTEFSVTVDGETASHNNLVERMSANEADAILAFDRQDTQTVTLHNSVVTEVPRERSAGENQTELDITLQAQRPGLSIAPGA